MSGFSDNPTVLHWEDCGGQDEDINALRRILDVDPSALETINNAIDFKTPLQRAVIAKHKNCVEFLLKLGADPNATNMFGTTALHFALHHEDTEIAKILLNNGANPNYEPTDFTGTLNRANYLVVSCRIAAFEMVQLLLECGAMTQDLLAIQENGSYTFHTPLSVATFEGDLKCIKLLLLYGAVANLKDFQFSNKYKSIDRHSIPHILIEECTKPVAVKIEILKLLHEFGVDLLQKNRYGYSALEVLKGNLRSPWEEKKILVDEFEKLVSKPLSLQSLSRLAVVNAMGKEYFVNIPKLPYLPPQILALMYFCEL